VKDPTCAPCNAEAASPLPEGLIQPIHPPGLLLQQIAVFGAEDSWEGAGVAEESPELLAEEKGGTIAPVVCQPYLQLVKDVPRFQTCMRVAKRIGPMDSAAKVDEFVGPYMRQLDQESFVDLSLDVKKRVRGFAEIHKGTRDKVEVSNADIQRYAVATALLYGAKSLIVVHNHPSGDYEPSKADIELTRWIHQACLMLDILLLDHVVIGLPQGKSGKSYFSFMEENLIPLGRAA
jgi:DNA repair protein RadC